MVSVVQSKNYQICSYIHTLIRNNHVCYRFPFWSTPLVRLSQTLSDIHVVKICNFSMLNNLITHLKCVHYMVCCGCKWCELGWGSCNIELWLTLSSRPFSLGWHLLHLLIRDCLCLFERVWFIFWVFLIGINLSHQNLDESIGRFTKPLWRGTIWYHHSWWDIFYYMWMDLWKGFL